MLSNLIDHIKKFITIDEADAEMILTHFQHQLFTKKSLLLEEGQICNKQYFILKGCVRFYINNNKGVEQTLQFGIENWWITDYLSFQYQTPSHFNIQAIEKIEVLSIDRKSFDELLDRIPKLEKYFRLVIQKSFGASQVRIRYLFTMSAEERFHHMNSMFPEFIQRVPQYMIASYLDFSPEFMSKIRAGKV
ncbi:CRP-like cAMP-binding protein [Flavobacterium arsenatis]|uniref:CRP-like cAMP-binding protein n=1 Tax=Flavobacterium arsenatis TaxID=1484332 RepID=A0ABU1TJ44_9FLAO|nr:Crp/Fnr family transcriptional regulator [Flavobacterium arsenatis]MDR6966014.1 CRP-like cAMP-binding protein [Flavobacterium arsenatis]